MTETEALSEADFESNPFDQFNKWYTARDTTSIAIPGSVSLGTASSDGRVSIRTVLLKGYDDMGFVFFTNYKSRKSSDILTNPMAALLFYWPESGRQIRIEGRVKKTSEEESEKYFASRPWESQVSAWASEQSSVIPHRKHLDLSFEYFKSQFAGQSVDKPPWWGGFRLLPDWFEFWQDGGFRLHDRIIYRKENEAWIKERLAP
jgi:pyridoxamine 5'-phosphate oxidase